MFGGQYLPVTSGRNCSICSVFLFHCLVSFGFVWALPWQAVGKYEEAGDHAIRCFDYYLQHSANEDTDVLTRMGNLQACFGILDGLLWAVADKKTHVPADTRRWQ